MIAQIEIAITSKHGLLSIIDNELIDSLSS